MSGWVNSPSPPPPSMGRNNEALVLSPINLWFNSCKVVGKSLKNFQRTDVVSNMLISYVLLISNKLLVYNNGKDQSLMLSQHRTSRLVYNGRHIQNKNR